MSIKKENITINTSPIDLVLGKKSNKYYSWDPRETNELTLMLNTYKILDQEGWDVCLKSPVKGIQRNYRIPIFAVKGKAAIVTKPVRDPKKVNIAGLKMLNIKFIVKKILPEFEVKPVVFAFLSAYDSTRRTSCEYEVWLRGEFGILD